MCDLEHVEEIWGPTPHGQKELRLLVNADAHKLVTPQAVANAVSFAFRGRQLRRFQGPAGEVEMDLPDPCQ